MFAKLLMTITAVAPTAFPFAASAMDYSTATGVDNELQIVARVSNRAPSPTSAGCRLSAGDGIAVCCHLKEGMVKHQNGLPSKRSRTEEESADKMKRPALQLIETDPSPLYKHPLDLIECYLVGYAVIDLRCGRRNMSRHVLGSFKRAAIPHIFRYPGRPECVAADMGGDARGDGPAFNHTQRIIPVHPIRCQCLPATDCAEKRSAWLALQASGVYIFQQVLLGVVMQRHLMKSSAFLVQTHPIPTAVHPQVIHPHFQRRPDSGKRVYHEPDERPVPKPDNLAYVDRVEQHSRVGRRQNGGLSLGGRDLRSLHSRRRIHTKYAAGYEIVEQHTNGG
jgi:hypothetical protein